MKTRALEGLGHYSALSVSSLSQGTLRGCPTEGLGPPPPRQAYLGLQAASPAPNRPTSVATHGFTLEGDWVGYQGMAPAPISRPLAATTPTTPLPSSQSAHWHTPWLA